MQNSAAEEEKTNHSLRQPGSVNDMIQCCSCEEIFKTGDNGWVCCSSDDCQNITCPTCMILFNLPTAVDSTFCIVCAMQNAAEEEETNHSLQPGLTNEKECCSCDEY